MNTDRFPHLEFRGTHRAIGEQHGEALRTQVRQHLEVIYAQARSKSNLGRERVLELAQTFVPYIEEYAPDFIDELHGLAHGAGISFAEAVLLQVRQEAAHTARFGEASLECTSFAVTAPYTRSGRTFAGQNADLAGNIEDFSAVVSFAPPGKPAILMLIPAGQLSYLGMNSEGMGAFANFLSCTDWRVGFPRYLLTRLALEQYTLADAVTAVLTPRRASSRNLMLADRHGHITDIEMTATVHTMAQGKGCLTHANHFVLPGMAQWESTRPHEFRNSTCRHNRISALLEERRGAIGLAELKEVMCDHANGHDSICAHPGGDKDWHTFASLIAVLDEARMEVAKGPPCAHEYVSYAVARPG